MMLLSLLPDDYLLLFLNSFAVTVMACQAWPMLIPQHDSVGSWLIVTILIFFAVTLTACYAAVPMLIPQDAAAAIATG